MSGLPLGWAETTLGQIASFEMGQAPAGKDCNREGDGTVFVKAGEFGKLRPAVREWTTDPKKYATRGDVLICVVGATSGKLNLGIDCAIGRSVAAIKPSAVTTQKAIYLQLLPKVLELRSASTGSAQGVISKEMLANIELVLPPLTEQTRIADKLDALLARVDAIRARLDTIPALLKRFRQSVLAAATSGALTEEWRGGVEAEWETVALEDVATDFSYGSAAKSAKNGEVPVLRMGNIQSGQLDWESLVYTSDKAEIAKYELSTGDVLFNRTNSPELVGKTAVFRGDREAIYAGYLIRVRCSEKLLPDFLSFCLNGPIGMHWRWEVKTDGVSQSNINATKLAAFVIELPPLDEQHEIVRRVESLFAIADRVQAQYTTARARVDKLSPALLAKAFRGELVPQDPNDEPAAQLLARLRADKASQPKPVKQGHQLPAVSRKTRKAG